MRSFKVCELILDKPEFDRWENSSTGTVLTMFGDMGYGKTAVTSCVENYVTANLDWPDPSAAVLAFHCKAYEGTPLCDIYKGLIYQLVMSRPFLKADFKKLARNEQLNLHRPRRVEKCRPASGIPAR